MLTTLTTQTQPQLTEPRLTLASVSAIEDRLRLAMKRGKASAAELARACDISPSAVSKWFNGKADTIKAVHVFAVARRCKVNPEWLATGEGKPDLPKDVARAYDIPDRRLELIRLYGRLPDEVRFHIRGIIEALAAASSDSYARWSTDMAAKAKRRDEHAVHEP